MLNILNIFPYLHKDFVVTENVKKHRKNFCRIVTLECNIL